MVRLALVLTLLIAALAPASAEAKRVKTSWFQNASVAERFWTHIGHIPVNTILEPGPHNRVKAGGTTYIVNWVNSLGNRESTTVAFRHAKAISKNHGIYTDRFLRSSEKRSWQVLLDLARDADVLVVHRENPVCASGVSLAQARGIARGTITRWSQVTTLPEGQPDAIRRRLVGSPGKRGDAWAEPRFGAPYRSPHTVVRSDGGVSEARQNRAVVAVTSWSRVRRGSGACVVAIGGVAPSNASVHALKLPGAYPVQYVMHRKRSRARQMRLKVRAYVGFLKSARVSEMLRNTGVLLASEPPPADPPSGGGGGGAPSSSGGPSRDYQGRPITSVRDDDAARAELAGERLESGPTRHVFDANGVYVYRYEDETGCQQAHGTWAVAAAWRYSEHGGGIIAQVHIDLGQGPAEALIELPNDSPGTGYLDGRPHTRDAALVGGCG